MKLIQKGFLKGVREFEIIEDAIYVRIKGLLKEEKLTISLSALNAEPVVNGSLLEFYGHATHGANREPVLSLLLNNPNVDEFNAFIDVLKQGVIGEDKSFATFEIETPESLRAEALARNVYEEPPDFDTPSEKTPFKPVNAERIESDITMLKTYLDEGDIRPLLDALETLRAEPENEAAFEAMVGVFNTLGINKGAVLTYAPYIKVLVSKTIWL